MFMLVLSANGSAVIMFVTDTENGSSVAMFLLMLSASGKDGIAFGMLP